MSRCHQLLRLWHSCTPTPILAMGGAKWPKTAPSPRALVRPHGAERPTVKVPFRNTWQRRGNGNTPASRETWRKSAVIASTMNNCWPQHKWGAMCICVEIRSWRHVRVCFIIIKMQDEKLSRPTVVGDKRLEREASGVFGVSGTHFVMRGIHIKWCCKWNHKGIHLFMEEDNNQNTLNYILPSNFVLLFT